MDVAYTPKKERIGKRIVGFAGPFNNVALCLLSEKSISGLPAGFSSMLLQNPLLVLLHVSSLSSPSSHPSLQLFFDWWPVNFALPQVSSWAWMRPPPPSCFQQQTPPARPSESKCWLWPMWGLFRAARTTFTGKYPAFSFCLLKQFLMYIFLLFTFVASSNR